MKKRKLVKNNRKDQKVVLYEGTTNENCPHDGGNCNCPTYSGTYCVNSCGKN